MEIKQKKDTRDLISNYLKMNGIKQSFIANLLGITDSHLSLILKKERDLSDKHRVKFNEKYKTQF